MNVARKRSIERIQQKEQKLKEVDTENEAGKQVQQTRWLMERMEVTQGRYYLEVNKGKQFLTMGKLCKPRKDVGINMSEEGRYKNKKKGGMRQKKDKAQ